MKKNKIFLITALAFICLVGCSKTETAENWQEYDENLGEVNIKDDSFDKKEEEITPSTEITNNTEIKEEESTQDNAEDEFGISAIDNNVSEDIILNTFSINEKTFSLPVATEELGLEMDFAFKMVSMSYINFNGSAYGIQHEPNNLDSFKGYVYIEEIDYTCKAICSDYSKSDDDVIVVFVDSIKAGDKISDIKAKLGEGFNDEGYIYFKNDSGCLAIKCEEDIAEEIYLFPN